MNPIIEHYELIKEEYFIFESIDTKVKSRIYKIIKGANASFTWETSHYCRLADEATIYTPSAPFGNSLDEIENKLNNYISRFENAVEWQINEDF